MISQCSLCITHSPIHTVEYYTKMAMELIELGADEICIKDMAGIRRRILGTIVATSRQNIRKYRSSIIAMPAPDSTSLRS